MFGDNCGGNYGKNYGENCGNKLEKIQIIIVSDIGGSKMEETTSEIQLPEHWIWVELQDLTNNPKNDIVDGPFGSNLKSEEYKDTGIPVFKIQNIKENRFVDKNINFVSPAKAEELSRHSFQKGDLIVTKLGNPLGLCCKVPEKYPYGIIVADLIRFRPSFQTVIIQYLMYGINSVIVQNQFKVITKGTTRPRVNLTIVREIKFPLPPLPEQRAIVSKIEQLFSELDNGISNLKLAQQQLKVYRQAVLKKAFEGELTRKWREQQTNLPKMKDLLEQISKKREEAAKVSGKKLKQVKSINEDEMEKLPTLPENWRWMRLGRLVNEIVVGYVGPITQFLTDNIQNGIRLLSTTHIGENKFLNNKEIRYVTSKFSEKNKKSEVLEGDIIVARHGDSGKCCIIPSYIKKAQVSNVVIVRPNNKTLISQYIVYSFEYLKSDLQEKKVGGVQQVVNTKIMEEFPFPLCSLPEQQAIVQEIETRLSVCDKIEKDIELNLEKAEALRQSILKKAFEGKLLNERELAEVRKAEDWEPAEVLLERIKAEKAGNKEKGNKESGQPKSVVLDEKEFTQQYTLDVFEQVEK